MPLLVPDCGPGISGRIGGVAEVVVSGGGDCHSGVPVGAETGVQQGDLPARHLAGVVAAGACASPVLECGGAAFSPLHDVVDVADGAANKRRHHFRPELVARMADASSAVTGP